MDPLPRIAALPEGDANRFRLREQAVAAHTALAVPLAGRHRRRGVPAEDLEHVALLGLDKDVDRLSQVARDARAVPLSGHRMWRCVTQPWV